MKAIFGVWLALFLCGALSAQILAPGQFSSDSTGLRSAVISQPSIPEQSFAKGNWELGTLTGFGSGVGYAQNTRFAYAGFRLGRILTGTHFSGWGRGNFEWAVEILPVYPILTSGRTVYGGSFKPVIWKYNFISGRRVAPYALVAGGIVFSTRNVPLGNTSWVNFSPQAAFGAHFFTRSRQSMFMEIAFVHHSDAGLTAFNPGYNASIFLTIGYDWFRSRDAINR